MNRGAVLVIALAVAGLAAASVAVWFQHRQTRQALALWGAPAAQRIERAPVVEIVELDDSRRADSGDTDGMLDPAAAIDFSQARGLLHFRRSLLQDANFDWSSDNAPVSDGEWDYVVWFSDDEGSVVVLFDMDRGIVANRAATERVARMTEKMSRGMSRFLDDIIASANPAP
jgi:hypothetical protein